MNGKLPNPEASEEAIDDSDVPMLPNFPFQSCPIQTSLGVLGRKWTLLILRDIGLLKVNRFNQILATLPGMPPKVLSTRLHELEAEGYIKRVEKQRSPMMVKWALTQKGRDTLPILMRFIAFGSKWYPEVVFSDKASRSLGELFSLPEAKQMIDGYT